MLDDTLMPAVDHHHPGGLTWTEAVIVLRSILQTPPRLDRDGALAARLVSPFAVGVASMPPAFSKNVP